MAWRCMASLCCLALASCAAPPPAKQAVAEELVVVLPSADGTTGAVVVERDGSRRTVDRPYAANRVHADGRSEAIAVTEQDVARSFGATLAALPARPATFVVFFIAGGNQLTAESVREMDRIRSEVRSRPVPDVLVIGHTDTVGGVEANDKLSMERAERVKALLTAAGVAGERIQTTGRGERELLVPTADNVDESRNRRVEINVR